LTVNSTEDQIYVITNTGQLLKGDMELNLEGAQPHNPKFDYLQEPFHKGEITGLDVCIRKQLIVTGSKDKTVSIWNYETRKRELTHQFTEEVLAVAFHPSGLHLLVALTDKIQFCNILSKSLNSFKQVTVKNCSEIRFSHGGHLFAAAMNSSHIHVYNFYTTDCPLPMQYTGHTNKVRCIDWFENDMGFASCGHDGNIYFFDLYTYKEQQKRNTDKDFNKRDVKFLSCVNIPGKPYEVYAVGSDKSITSNVIQKKAQKGNGAQDLDATISQLAITKSGKALFAGVGESRRPGAIQIWRFPMEKVNVVQAHSKPIERLRMNFDNTHLFSVGQDGMLCIFDVKDKDPRGLKPEPSLKASEEILTEKQEMEMYITEKDSLIQEFKNL